MLKLSISKKVFSAKYEQNFIKTVYENNYFVYAIYK